MIEIIERLQKLEHDFVKASDEVTKTSIEYYNADRRYELIKARVKMTDSIMTLRSQELRDAQAEIYMSEREDLKKEVDKYLDAKQANKEAWGKYNVLEILIKNTRAILNYYTFGDKNASRE